jgi:eukaryotic-like serine/threonine-protein kinase
MRLENGVRLGIYEVHDVIGAGGMGEVYRARDTKLGREVAIKILPASLTGDPERLARFTREAQVLASLNHPNIAAIYHIEEAADGPAIVMELIDGDTLADRIARGPISLEEALPIAKQIAEALEAAHEQGIIHRDLKPANIKVRPDGTVKVLDFGLAKLAESTQSSTTTPAALSISPTVTSPALVSGVGVLLGTAAYMSPEQAKGRAADKRSDVWAFGCVLFEMLTGKNAFDGEDIVDVLGAVARLDPNWQVLPPDVPPSLRVLLQSCLTKDRRRRIADISTALFVLDHRQTLAGPVSDARPAQRPWMSYAAAVGATAVITTSGFIATRPTYTPPPSVKRFSLDLAGNTSFSATGRHVVALSPDGSAVAFVSANRIYVRPMNNLEAQPIAGTELGGSAYGRNPFFSPDGRWIGFQQSGELKKAPVSGGAIVTIARNVNTPYGATWLDDDTILFGAGETGIWQVSANGRAPKRIIAVENGQLAHGPQLLPDHDHVLFTLAKGADWNDAQIVAQSLSTGTRTVLVPQGTDGRYVDGGYLLYGLRGTVFGAAVDIENMKVLGAAVPILQNVSQAPFQTGAMHFAVSRNGTLAYAVDSAVVSSRLMWIDRTGRSTPLVATPAPFYAPRISPDGKRVAVVRRDDKEGDSIWTVDAERATVARLTPTGTDRRYPIWSGDGRTIGYGSQRERRVFRQAADGSGTPEELAAGVGTNSGLRPLAFDMANQSVLVQSRGGSTGGITRVSLRDPHDTRAVPNANAYENAALSSDGRWVAYESEESGLPQIYVRPFPNVDEGRWQVSTGGGTQAVWSKNGRELFYVEPPQNDEGDFQRLISVPVLGGDAFRTAPPVALFKIQIGRADGGPSYDVTPDGQRFVFSTASNNSFEGARIVIVENWFEELKRLVPTK